MKLTKILPHALSSEKKLEQLAARLSLLDIRSPQETTPANFAFGALCHALGQVPAS